MILALDLGTTGCKALAMDDRGQSSARARRDLAVTDGVVPAVETDTETLWRQIDEVMSEIGRRLQGRPVDRIVPAGAMHSLLALDEHDQPLGPATLWADQRAHATAQAWADRAIGLNLMDSTGCPWRGLYHPARIRHWIDARPPWIERVHRWMQIKDYVVLRVTGQCRTDHQIASTTGMFDQLKKTWCGPALELAGIEASFLPEPIDSLAPVGVLRPELADRWALRGDLVVIGGGSDGALSSLGAGAIEPGHVVINAGTSGAIRMAAENAAADRSGASWRYLGWPARYIVGGALNNIGLALEWCLRCTGSKTPDAEGWKRFMDEAFGTSPAGSRGLVFLPYLVGDRSPWWIERSFAGFSGFSATDTRADIRRAVLEATVYCFFDLWSELARVHPAITEGGRPIELTGSLGGERRWAELLASLLDRPVSIRTGFDGTLLGCVALGLASLDRVEDAIRLASGEAGTHQGEHGVVYPDAGLSRDLCAGFANFVEYRAKLGVI
ncbi:MAG: hypothetical protein JJU36_00460 [Phycisphaeraceae bacterium]|nr:hypothetical protein [Phycisphaeraceae bacterium]